MSVTFDFCEEIHTFLILVTILSALCILGHSFYPVGSCLACQPCYQGVRTRFLNSGQDIDMSILERQFQ